ncbi:MAG: phosphopyruvate hydratase [Candidatus Bathyarchaeia archaeon]
MTAASILKVKARKVFDSRGAETIEVEIITEKNVGRAIAPSGASKGRWEVKSYPQGGVDESIRMIREKVAPRLIGMSLDDFNNIDFTLHELDGTFDFSNLGGNAAYAISIASVKAGAASREIPLFKYLAEKTSYELPYPLGNVIGGGLHAKGGKTDIQEFLVLPTSAETFIDAATANIKTHSEVSRLAERKGIILSGKGDEGAWVAPLKTEEALEILSRACETVSDETGVRLRIGIDMASSSIWSEKDRVYTYQMDARKLSESDQIDFVLNLIRKFKLAYVEDPFHEESFEAFAELTAKARDTLICGDDLFTTNMERLKRGIENNAGNAIIIKPNQVGTVTDTLKTVKLAKESNYVPVVSHRSGESCDADISHLAVAVDAPIIKLGIIGGERASKVNELIRIWENLGEKVKMATIKI